MQSSVARIAGVVNGLDDLRKLERGCLKKLFATLPAPSLPELRGEYQAELLDQGGRIANFVIRTCFHGRGRWIGKAFNPAGDEGRGYNIFRRWDTVVQRYPMKTYVALGRCGKRPSLFLDYRPYNNGVVRSMIDEVRKVGPGVFLGWGVVGPELLLRRKIPFLLHGPTRAYSPTAEIAARTPQAIMQKSA